MVFHHSAITYGASGGWYWHERPAGTSPGLTLFVTMNQAWFMGLFFLIAGHFTPSAYDRKGAASFMRTRLWRLGLPLLAFAALLDPLTNAIARWRNVLPGWERRILALHMHPGPLWFAEALLIFSALYCAWRTIATGATRPMPSAAAVLAAALLTGAAAFAIRMVWPVGIDVVGLQPAYFAGYAVLFAAGVAGAAADWPGRVTGRAAAGWLAVSALALIALLASTRLPGAQDYSGGWAVKPLVYAMWEPLFACGVIIALLWSFKRWLDQPVPLLAWTARRAFAVYVIHPPILVAITRCLQSWEAAAGSKTLVAGTLACCACWAAASILVAVPGVRRVL